ncbi:MAG: tetratricopeptide repeat protein [Erythrobacter sp.]
MTTPLKTVSLRLAGAALMAASVSGAVLVAPPAAAQDSAAAEARLKKIEAEVRALQRKVFPGGDGKFFEPQIAPGAQGPATTTAPATTGAPSTTAVTDILVRLDALEQQLQAMTARSEEQANTMSQLERRLTVLETAANAPVVAAAPATPAPSRPALQPVATTPTPTAAPATRPAAQVAAATPAPRPASPAPAPATTAAAAAPSAARLAAVQAIAKPQTTDAADDEYSYGFRLWNAGFFPEARQQLAKYVEQYPTHAKISYGRNLLGRAFLDDKMPEDAARWFLKNYQANKAGERAPDSLLYLGASMVAMKDTKRACIALAEFAETYPLVAAGRLATEYQTTRAKVKCS